MAERPIDQLTLREMFTDAEWVIRDLTEHLKQNLHPKSRALDELVRSYRIPEERDAIADTAGKFPSAEEMTADFVYVRLHGSTALYASDYSDAELDRWAERIWEWSAGGRDVYVYFDNDALGHAPRNARALAGRLGIKPSGTGITQQ